MRPCGDGDQCLYARNGTSPMLSGEEVVMGLIRKLTYFGTHGLIDIRSDAERIASYSRTLLQERKRADARSHCDAGK